MYLYTYRFLVILVRSECLVEPAGGHVYVQGWFGGLSSGRDRGNKRGTVW